MKRMSRHAVVFSLSLSATCIPVLLMLGSMPSTAQSAAAPITSSPQFIPNTGQTITPLAPAGASFDTLNPNLPDFPDYVVGQAVTSVVSPDKKTLLVLTSGYNLLNTTSGPTIGHQINNDSTEYVFVYDISTPVAVKKQVLQVPNTYNGITFDPHGFQFYVSGGVDDNVHLFLLNEKKLWVERPESPVALHHRAGNGLLVRPEAAGIASTQDRTKLVVANYFNDSVSVLTRNGNGFFRSHEIDLRPGKINKAQSGIPGGEYPFWVSIKGSSVAYVSSLRDREIVVVDITHNTVTNRIKVSGQPNKMTLNKSGSRLYVAEDQADVVGVIDTDSNQLLEEIPVSAPPSALPSTLKNYKGSNTNSATLSPDEQTLYVTNGNANDIAVVALSNAVGQSQTIGLIPTGWYPNSVSLSADGKTIYAVNGKSPTGPNPGNCHGLTDAKANACYGSNEYNLQLIKAGFQTIPVPAAAELATLTEQVAANDHFSYTMTAHDAATMSFLRGKVKHVIYIIKENRTYDQVLGDLEVGNGDPNLTEFGETITPNLHNLARNFVTLDSFYDSSEVSFDGWPWSTSARAPDLIERNVTVNYAGRGLSYDAEGTNRNVNVSLPTLPERLAADPLTPADPDILPGVVNAGAPDDENGNPNLGYLWNGALKAGKTVRNYGFFLDLARYQLPAAYAALQIPEEIDPASKNLTVAYSTDAALRPVTDPYFRGFDQSFPDFYRFKEWEREFDTTYSSGNLPDLTLLRLAHDHTGNFNSALFQVNTPELEVSDNDYAVGLVAQKIAGSQYAGNTLIFVIEDDAQDGADHIESHRSTAYVVGPYVKQHQVVSTPYTTIGIVRTIEEILGLPPVNLNDSTHGPMTDVFDTAQNTWTFKATPSDMLYDNTTLPLPPRMTVVGKLRPTHDAKYWEAATIGMNFSSEDLLNGAQYNKILWKGLMGDAVYPENSTGQNLRQNRAELLARYHERQQARTAATSTRAEVTGAHTTSASNSAVR